MKEREREGDSIQNERQEEQIADFLRYRTRAELLYARWTLFLSPWNLRVHTFGIDFVNKRMKI